jgi:hypothetical protein
MPLVKGASKKAVGENIGRLVSEGKSKEQAEAIALKEAGLSKDEWTQMQDAGMTHHDLFDTFVIDGTRRTRDGYMTAFAKVARTGIQIYNGKELGRPDLGDVAVYRPSEEVFHADAMRSMAHRPVTLHHPSESVNADNWSKYARGYTGDEVVRDGDHVRVPLMITDGRTIKAIEAEDTRELSMGYSTDLKWEKGTTHDGQPYDAVQTAIRANHLAVVPVARGGSTLRLGDQDGKKQCQNCGASMQMDATKCPACLSDVKDQFYDRDFTAEQRKKLSKSGAAMPDGSFPISTRADLANAIKAVGRAKDYAKAKAHIISRARALGATASLPDDWVKSTKDAAPGGQRRGDKLMLTTIIVDSVPVELDDVGAQIVRREIGRLMTALDASEKKVTKSEADKEEAEEESQKQMDAMKKSCDAKDGEIAVLKKQVSDAAITPEKLDALLKDRMAVVDAASRVLDRAFVFDGKKVEDIRRAAVSAKLGDAVVKEMNDAAIEGAFKAITVDAPQGGTRALARALSSQQQNGRMSATDMRDAAFAENEKRLNDAWRGPARRA